jgi:hypothetical protein
MNVIASFVRGTEYARGTQSASGYYPREHNLGGGGGESAVTPHKLHIACEKGALLLVDFIYE